MTVKETAYYDLLSVPPTATAAEIRKAFRVQALKSHPDRAGNSEEATAAFQHLRAVYDVLIDPDRRATYDQFGDTGSLHGDDENIDVAAAASFFSRTRNPVTEEDIQAYETSYRDGPDELEDLVAHFNRFEGNVTLVCDYIPYSDESDLKRFIAIWDGKIEDASLTSTKAWVKARKALLKKGRGKERQLSAPEEIDDEKASTGKRRKKSSKAQKEAEDRSDLFAMIRARADRNKAQFDDWADGLAARAEERLKAQSKSRAKPKQKSKPKSTEGTESGSSRKRKRNSGKRSNS